MSGTRQPKQLMLPFSENRGEAPSSSNKGVEPLKTVGDTESPANSDHLDTGRSTGRTAVYGPVRTVVWEGWGREASPYPDSDHEIASLRSQ